MLSKRNIKTQVTKVKGWKEIYQANPTKIKMGVIILISEKVDFRTRNITRHKEEHYMITKG